MEQIRILCYGDSNTWGYIPGGDHIRYGDNERWTKVLDSLLGERFEVIEEGLNGRTLLSNDPRPGKDGRNGYEYLLPCLDKYAPIDLFVIMLGTNELKTVYNRTTKEIGEIFEQYYVKTILNSKSKFKDESPKLLIVVPPVVNEETEHCKGDSVYDGITKRSMELSNIYKSIAEKYNCYFLDNDGLKTGIDGLHLTKESHRLLAEKLKEVINKIYD